MALEDEIRALTDAIKENTARLDKMLGGATAPATKADKPAAAATKKKPEVTVDDIAAAAGAYLKSGDKSAKANLARITEHYGIDRLTSVDPKHFGEMLAMIKTFADGGEPEQLDAAADEGDDDSMI